MNNLNGDLEGVIESLRRLHWAAENRVTEAQVAHELAKAERDHIARMLKAAGVYEEEAPKTKPKVRPLRVNEQTRATILTAIHRWIDTGERALEQVPHSFTIMDLEKLTSVHPSSIRNAVSNLRDDGLVRAVGLKPTARAKPPMAYVLGEGNEESE